MDGFTYKKLEELKNKRTFEVKVEYSVYKELEDKIFAESSKKVKLAGFRPGKAPKELIEKEIASSVFSKTINKLLTDLAYEILTKEDLNPISHIDYDLKDFDKDKGLTFTFTFLNQPKIDIEKLKKISVKKEEIVVKAEEIDDVIRNMIRNNLPVEKYDKNAKVNPESSSGQKSEVEGQKLEDQKPEEVSRDFEITNELVKELGYEDAKTYDEIKAKVKETLTKFKDEQVSSDYNGKIIEAAVKAVDFDLPEDMVNEEVTKKEEDFKNRLRKIKLDIDAYLKTQSTTIEKLKENWANEAKAQISTDLLLVNLAVQEKLVPTEEDVDAEIEKIEDKKLKAQYKGQRNKDYLRTLMTRERGFTRLVELIKK